MKRILVAVLTSGTAIYDSTIDPSSQCAIDHAHGCPTFSCTCQ